MRSIGTKVIALDEFGYEQPVVFKELTLSDMSKISSATKAIMKMNDGDISEADTNIILLQHLIKSAPFEITREGIGDLPLSLAVYLIEEAKEMLDPLLNKKQKDSSTIMQEDVQQVLKSQDISTDSNCLNQVTPVEK
jgi:hypothetical protein